MPAASPARPALLGAAAAGVSGAVAAAAAGGRAALICAVVVVQAMLAAGWLRAAAIPGAAGAAVVVVVAAAAADGYAARDSAEPLAPVAGVVAVAFLATLLLQLAQRGRTRVTESLAVTMTGVLLVVLAAHLVAVLGGAGESAAAVLVALAAGAAVLAGRLVDEVAPRQRPAGEVRRGWPGLLAGLVAAAAAGMLAGGNGALGAGSGVVIGIAVGVAATLAEVGVEQMATGLSADRRRSAVLLLGAVLPLVVAAPVGYAVTRLLVE